MEASAARRENTLKIRSLDTVANVVVIAAAGAVLMGFVTAKSSSPSGSRAPTNDIAVYKVGDLVQPRGEMQFSGETFLLFTRSTCGYCTKSMPLYRSMLEKGARIIAVTAEDVEVNRAYLAENQVFPKVVLPLAETGLRFRVTPSVISVDSRGAVTGTWWGFQTEKDADALLRRFQ
jgi:hypothetical protein